MKNHVERKTAYKQYFSNHETKNRGIIQDFSKEIEFVDVSPESISQSKTPGEIEGELEFFEVPSTPELSKNIQEKYSFNKIASTFNLTIDKNGNLIGLNVKPKASKKVKRKRISTESKDGETEEEPSIFGRITGLFSRIRLKTSSEEGGSRISNVLGRIKSIFSRS